MLYDVSCVVPNATLAVIIPVFIVALPIVTDPAPTERIVNPAPTILSIPDTAAPTTTPVVLIPSIVVLIPIVADLVVDVLKTICSPRISSPAMNPLTVDPIPTFVTLRTLVSVSQDLTLA